MFDLEYDKVICQYGYRKATVVDVILRVGFGVGDEIDDLRRELAKDAGESADNHVVVELRRGDATFYVAFSDWRMSIGLGVCV